jgi:hypothetical protein
MFTSQTHNPRATIPKNAELIVPKPHTHITNPPRSIFHAPSHTHCLRAHVRLTLIQQRDIRVTYTQSPSPHPNQWIPLSADLGRFQRAHPNHAPARPYSLVLNIIEKKRNSKNHGPPHKKTTNPLPRWLDGNHTRTIQYDPLLPAGK